MAPIETGLSVNFEIGGQAIPLQSAILQLNGQALQDAIREALINGLEFSLPPGHAVEVPLAEFSSWLAAKDLTLPTGFDQVVAGTTITITACTISTSGKFNIVLRVTFAEGVLPADLPLGDLINIQEIGLRLAYEP
jgi:hypothetical protein